MLSAMTTNLIHARHRVSGRVQEITRDQFEVFSDVLEEITAEEAEKHRVATLLGLPTEPAGEGAEATVVDQATEPVAPTEATKTDKAPKPAIVKVEEGK